MLSRPFLLWFGLVSALTAVGLIVAHLLEPPYSWVAVGLTLVAIAGGTHFLLRTHPLYRYYRRRPPTVYAWVPPLLFAFAGIAFTKQLLGGPFAWAGLAVSVAGVVLLVGCQYVLTQEDDPFFPLAHLTTNLILYFSAFIMYVALQTGSGLNAISPLLGAFSGLAALELLREQNQRPTREIVYAVVVGVLIAELSWGLYYLSLGKIYSGLALIIAFYLVVGLSHSHLQGRLNHWIALEFVAVAAAGLAVLYGFRNFGG